MGGGGGQHISLFHTSNCFGAPEICERVCKNLLDVVIILSVILWPKNATWNTNSNKIERERLFSLRMLNKDTVNFSIIAFIHFINL